MCTIKCNQLASKRNIVILWTVPEHTHRHGCHTIGSRTLSWKNHYLCLQRVAGRLSINWQNVVKVMRCVDQYLIIYRCQDDIITDEALNVFTVCSEGLECTLEKQGQGVLQHL